VNAPARIAFLSALALICAFVCRGDIILNWLDTPMVLSAPFFPEETTLDINNDSIVDFTFGYDFHFVGLRSEGDSQYLIYPSPPPDIGGPVEPLSAGFDIGPESDTGSLEWFGTNTGFATLVSVFEGPGGGPVYEGRFPGQRAYIGVEFDSGGANHYGWIDIYVASGAYAEVYGWAYESNPETSIVAGAVPEPSTMLLLAFGTMSILALQSRRQIR
jgi:hypothetical protein